MRFLSMYKSVEKGCPPTVEEMTKWDSSSRSVPRPVTCSERRGCLPSVKGARVRRSGENITVTDGPFVETKEVVGGFALIQAKSKEEAIELIKIFLKVAGDGECEIRELYEQ